MKEKIYLILLHNIGISQKYLHLMFEKDKNYKEIYENAVTHEYLKWIWIRLKQREYILQKYREVKKEKIEKKLENREVKIVTYEDESYPESLKNIANPPYLFYLRWKLDSSPKIAVVGSRQMTWYGKKIIENILPDVATYFPITSGWAAGVDSLAHKTCMQSGYPTISVIWTWICQDYPVNNKKLYDDIVKSGWAVISIFSIDEPGNPYNFPIRNEIIVWLSVGVFVVEAQERSGSLITARLALESGRDVFTCPGDIFCGSSVGCNRLLKRGEAKSVFQAQHILEEYGVSMKPENNTKKIIFQDDAEQSIYNSLLIESLKLDEICTKLKMDIRQTSTKISLMEIGGFLYKNPDGSYSIK